tara:strand:- start:208 stop:1140 length:933 start_codon:yes stop_codon:yes gene_type:complete
MLNTFFKNKKINVFFLIVSLILSILSYIFLNNLRSNIISFDGISEFRLNSDLICSTIEIYEELNEIDYKIQLNNQINILQKVDSEIGGMITDKMSLVEIYKSDKSLCKYKGEMSQSMMAFYDIIMVSLHSQLNFKNFIDFYNYNDLSINPIKTNFIFDKDNVNFAEYSKDRYQFTESLKVKFYKLGIPLFKNLNITYDEFIENFRNFYNQILIDSYSNLINNIYNQNLLKLKNINEKSLIIDSKENLLQLNIYFLNEFSDLTNKDFLILQDSKRLDELPFDRRYLSIFIFIFLMISLNGILIQYQKMNDF